MIRSFTKWTLVLGLAVLPLAAQPFGGGPGGHRGKGMHQNQGSMMGRMATALKLTDAQKTQIEGIWKRFQELSAAKIQALDTARKAYRDAMHKPETSTDQLKKLYDAKSKASWDLMLDRRAAHNEVLNVLTPEQRADMEKWRAFRQADGRQGGCGQGGRGCGMGTGL